MRSLGGPAVLFQSIHALHTAVLARKLPVNEPGQGGYSTINSCCFCQAALGSTMRQPGTGWTLAAAALQPWQDAPVDKLLNPESVSIRLPLSAGSQRMGLFTSLGVELCNCPVTQTAAQQGTAGKRKAAETVEATFAVDSVLFAGGPVWALDWCPAPSPEDAAAGPLQTVETLAVATHPRSARRNPINVAQQGPGVVQLWGVPSSAECSQIPGGLPKLLALLWHEGRLAWDVKWCPDPTPYIQTSSNATGSSSSSSSSSRTVPLQGLLAAALANGDVVVWGVPTIQCLLDCAAQLPQQQQQHQQQQEQPQTPQALSLQLPYVWQLPAAAVGGSLSSCCSWLPSYPHDKMLVGCWDGNVVIWQLSLGAQGSTSAAPVQLLSADRSPIRAIAWQPNQRWYFTGDPEQLEAAKQQQQQQQQPQQQHGQQHASSNGSSSQLFLTASNNGSMKVWDVHDVLQACQERLITRHAVNSLLWLGPPHVWVAASADGNIRCFWVDAGAQSTGIPQQNADVSGSCGNVWGLSASLPMAVVAYVSDGGLLGLMPLEPSTGEPRHRKSHAALSAMALADDQLWVLTAKEIPGNGGLYYNVGKDAGSAARRAEANSVVVDPLPHPDQVLYAVAFSPNHRGLAMLAAGGGAGLVRLHAVSAEVVPVGW